MAVCRIVETGRTPDEFNQVAEKLGISGGIPPGAKVHIAALGDDGKIQVIGVWDSSEQADEFGQKVRAAREELGLGGMPAFTDLEVHEYATG